MTLRERLWPRLLLSHISLATIPVLILGILLIRTTRQSIETTVADGNFEVARRASNEIRLYIDQARNVIGQIADNMGMLDATPLERQKLIDNVVVKHDQFRELAVLDVNGKELLCTRLAPHTTPHIRADLTLPEADDVSISPVFISDDRLPMVTITVPILHFNQVAGYVTADVNLKDMWDLVDSVQIGGDEEQGAGNAYVVSGAGRLIAHPERGRVYGQEDLSATPIGQALSRTGSGTIVYQGPDGERIAAYMPIDPLGWYVVIEQPTAVAFARSREMKVEVTLLMALSAVVASLIGIIFARKIARPISELVRGAQLFAKGELTHTIDVPGPGEMTMLAAEFNSMARELMEKERQLQRAERLATLSKFASILSHEIRNPLNSMMINLQVLKREMERHGIVTEKNKKFYDIIVSEIWRIDGLVENFLTYACPPALNAFTYNVNEIIEEIIAVHKGHAEKQGIKIIARYERPNMLASVDANQLKQVFLNLLLNAFDAMEEGGTITIESREETLQWTGDLTKDTASRTYITIAFTDTGCGIEPEQAGRIFDVYFTSKSNGTGLGLPIAQQIIEKHGGKIEVSSRPGRGATFTIWLPMLSDELPKKLISHETKRITTRK